MSEENFKEKNIVIWGLGRYEHGSGLAAVKFFLGEGVSKIFISDLRTKEELGEQVGRVEKFAKQVDFQGEIIWSGMGHELTPIDFEGFDILVPNPAVPITKAEKLVQGHDIRLESEMTLFFSRCPKEKIIGITGTRGKSTTTALIHHILKEAGKNVVLGGNIAKGSPLEYIDQIEHADFFVLELSNFMLEYLDLKQQSPHIAILLNVLQDHLSRYKGNIDAYADVKAVITKYQTENDILVCNFANDYSKRIGESSKANVVWINKEADDLKSDDLPLRGEHNLHNVRAAIACTKALGVSEEQMMPAIKSFDVLHGRLQLVGRVEGVDFFNDTTSTTPVAALAALKSFMPSSLVLIAGGADKGLSFKELAQYISEHSDKIKIVWLFKDKKISIGGVRLKKALEDAGAQSEQYDVDNMPDAVYKAFDLAKPDGLVLLSPACSSFDLFKNEFDRGDQFNDAVKSLQV